MAILTNVDQFGKFNILDYSERLEIIDETGYYIEILCPACGAKNFKITKKTGQYLGYDCECMRSPEGKKEVMKAVLGPDWKDYSYSPRPNRTRKSSNQQKAKSAKINKIQSSDHGLCANLDLKADETITLGKLEPIPKDYPAPVKPRYIPKDIIATANKTGATQNQIQEITYHYSPTQLVKRFQWPNKESSKGHSKSFRQCHINDKKQTVWKKGNADWPLYRQAEAIKSGGWILFQEGEKCVEASRSLGIASVTTQGGNWDKANLRKSLKALQEANIPGIIFIGDNDEAGVKKATSLLEASLDLDFPVIVIPITQFWPEAPEKGDIADWLTWGKTNEMYNPDFIRRIEEEIHHAVNERKQRAQQNKDLPFLTEEDKEAKTLEILVKEFIQEKDPFKQAIKRKNFRARGIGDRQLDQLTQYLTHSSTAPQSIRIEPPEFRFRVSGGKQWLVPALIPATGVTLLTAPPGGSKSTFMFDLAGSILCGNSFMGEDIKENGPVIFACSDEPLDESQERALLQGFIHSDNYEFIENWTIRHMGLLEEAIADRKPKAVFVDSFDSIHREAGYDENSPSASEAIKKLNTLSQKYSCAIIVSHHENKDPKLSGVNKARGSSAIVASANAHIRLIGKDDDPETKVVKIEKLRGGATRSILCKVDYYNIRFEPEVNLEFEQDKDKRVALVNFLGANPSRFFEVQELNEYLGWSGKAIYRYLKQLTDRGEISRKPNSMGSKGMIYGFLCTNTIEADPVTPNCHTPPLPRDRE